MLLRELLSLLENDEESGEDFSGFNPSQVRGIEDYLKDMFDDILEIQWIIKSRQSDAQYEALAFYDGTNDKENRARLWFNCRKNGENDVSDFELISYRGNNFISKPNLD